MHFPNSAYICRLAQLSNVLLMPCSLILAQVVHKFVVIQRFKRIKRNTSWDQPCKHPNWALVQARVVSLVTAPALYHVCPHAMFRRAWLRNAQRRRMCVLQWFFVFFLLFFLLLSFVCFTCWNVGMLTLYFRSSWEFQEKRWKSHHEVTRGQVVVSIMTAWQRLRFHPSRIHRQSIGNHQVQEW